jgi:hypothetical protein
MAVCGQCQLRESHIPLNHMVEERLALSERSRGQGLKSPGHAQRFLAAYGPIAQHFVRGANGFPRPHPIKKCIKIPPARGDYRYRDGRLRAKAIRDWTDCALCCLHQTRSAR